MPETLCAAVERMVLCGWLAGDGLRPRVIGEIPVCGSLDPKEESPLLDKLTKLTPQP